MPKVTCSPCVATSVKKAERKALVCGVAPSWIRLLNSNSSIPTNPAPSSPVITSHSRVPFSLPSCIAIIAKP